MRRLLTVVSLVGLAVVSLGVAPAAAELNVCIKNSSGKMRAVTSLADCNPATESGEALATSAALAAAEVRITALEALLMGVTRSAGPPDTLVFTGMNLQVVNGTGATDGLPNGVGNVIIGYDVNSGDGHTYASHSGVVTGLNNTLSDAVAFVTLSLVRGRRQRQHCRQRQLVRGRRQQEHRQRPSRFRGRRLQQHRQRPALVRGRRPRQRPAARSWAAASATAQSVFTPSLAAAAARWPRPPAPGSHRSMSSSANRTSNDPRKAHLHRFASSAQAS